VLVLALETSALAGSVAVLDGERLLGQRQLATDRRSAQTLAPAIQDLLAGCGLAPKQINLVATTIGPGSFTGLRVGVTTAKTWAYAVGCDVIGLDTLDVVAEQAAELRVQHSGGELHAVMDAQRQELYLARYVGQAASLSLCRSEPNRIVPAAQWLSSLTPGTVVTGPGLRRITDRLPAGVIAAEATVYEPQAVTVGRMALAEHRRGRRDDLWKLAPAYLRPSAAEEKAGKAGPLAGEREA
jgi:tRNA threonylcarbamoyladenosine biosynthesis protein TsaB